MRDIKIAASSFAYQMKCHRCTWLMFNGAKAERQPMPSVFNKIDSLLKGRFADPVAIKNPDGTEAATNVASVIMGRKMTPLELPEGTRSFRSEDIINQQHQVRASLSVKVDELWEDENGGIWIIDLKTSEPKPTLADTYFEQFHCYGYGFQYPAVNNARRVSEFLAGRKIVGFAVVSWCPDKISFSSSGLNAGLIGAWKLTEVPMDWPRFNSKLDWLFGLVSGPIPEAHNECERCKSVSSINGIMQAVRPQDIVPLEIAPEGEPVAPVVQRGPQFARSRAR